MQCEGNVTETFVRLVILVVMGSIVMVDGLIDDESDGDTIVVVLVTLPSTTDVVDVVLESFMFILSFEFDDDDDEVVICIVALVVFLPTDVVDVLVESLLSILGCELDDDDEEVAIFVVVVSMALHTGMLTLAVHSLLSNFSSDLLENNVDRAVPSTSFPTLLSDDGIVSSTPPLPPNTTFESDHTHPSIFTSDKDRQDKTTFGLSTVRPSSTSNLTRESTDLRDVFT